MPRPFLGSVAEELYARLEPFHAHSDNGTVVTDEQLGWPLLIFWGLLAKRWQRIHDLSTDTDDHPGWSSIVDVDRVEDAGLNYTGQFKGVVPLQGLTPAQQRERIRKVDGFKRGTAEAIKTASKRRLTGEKRVILNERAGGNPYRIGVVTYIEETPDATGTFRDMVEQKPWGFIIEYTVVDAWGYDVLQVAFDDYGAIQAHYADYQGLQTNNPPAPTI